MKVRKNSSSSQFFCHQLRRWLSPANCSWPPRLPVLYSRPSLEQQPPGFAWRYWLGHLSYMELVTSNPNLGKAVSFGLCIGSSKANWVFQSPERSHLESRGPLASWLQLVVFHVGLLSISSEFSRETGN